MKGTLRIAMVLLVTLAASSGAWGIVPGDLDGDKIISQDELQKAESQLKNGTITSDQMEEISHIHDNYPRTIEDSANQTVTIYKPIKSVITFGPSECEVMRALKLNISEIVIGSSDTIRTKDLYKTLFPELGHIVNVGTVQAPEYERILSLKPDVAFISATSFKTQGDELQKTLESIAPNITVIRFDCARRSIYAGEVKKMGYLFERDNDAKEYADFYSDIVNTIKERVKDLPEDKKPRVYCERWSAYSTAGKGDVYNEMIELAGGRNIADFEGARKVDPEWIMKENPDIIIRGILEGSGGSVVGGGYHVDNVTDMKTIRDEIMSRPELANVTAVKTGKVYIFCYVTNTGSNLRELYFAKWFHPDLFKDVDPLAIHKEYLTRFQGLDFDLSKHGAFVYHPEEHPDGR